MVFDPSRILVFALVSYWLTFVAMYSKICVIRVIRVYLRKRIRFFRDQLVCAMCTGTVASFLVSGVSWLGGGSLVIVNPFCDAALGASCCYLFDLITTKLEGSHQDAN